jgi:lipid II:glycine glycyltransferase (peptidoglycan interpeptide bridge formation enzyme)
MNLITLEKPDKSWDEFVSAHSSLIFHTSLWGRVLKQGYGCEMKYLVLEEGGNWLLALPGMVVGNRFFKVLYSLIPYGGFIGGREFIPEFSKLLEERAKKEKIDRIKIVDLKIKKKQELPHFECSESYRHVLQLRGKSLDRIWQDYKPNLKRTIKRALDSDLTFEKIRDRKEVDQLYQLYLASMERNNALAKYPIDLFYTIFDLLTPESAEIFFVKHRNRPVAGIAVIYSEETAYYLHGGSSTEHLHLRPNDLLFHNAIKAAKEMGKSFFDFLGSDKGLPSLIQFKDKWGTRREELLVFQKDIGTIRPLLGKVALGLAQTPWGTAIQRKLTTTKSER